MKDYLLLGFSIDIFGLQVTESSGSETGDESEVGGLLYCTKALWSEWVCEEQEIRVGAFTCIKLEWQKLRPS